MQNRDLVEVPARASPGEPDERDDENGRDDAEELEDHEVNPFEKGDCPLFSRGLWFELAALL